MKRIGILLLIFCTCLTLAAWPQARSPYRIIIFDLPDAGTGAYQGTIPYCINTVGEVVGWYVDSNYVAHGFLRSAHGSVTTFDPTNSMGTTVNGNNPEGAITGYYGDAQGVNHGFLRASDGSFTTFDAPDAGAGQGQGTYGNSINPAGDIVGSYTDSNGVSHGLVRSRDGKITEFDAQGKGIGPIADTETAPCQGITPGGVIPGAYHDLNGLTHPFVRTRDGTITTFDVPGSVGAYVDAIGPDGAITGAYFQPRDVYHGYVRTPDGRIIKFDDPDAGNGPY